MCEHEFSQGSAYIGRKADNPKLGLRGKKNPLVPAAWERILGKSDNGKLESQDDVAF